jgi:hypothetical protein
MRIYASILTIALLILCYLNSNAQLHLALDEPEWKDIIAYEVKGRNGILINQKLSFGNFFTTSVSRSWTKGQSGINEAGTGSGNSYRKIISKEYVERNQTIFFVFEDSSGLKADVHCASDFRVNDLIIGNSGVSIPGLTGSAKTGENLYYAQIYTNTGEPWQMLIDNDAAQQSPLSYETRLAKSKDEYYVITPYRKVKNNKGKITELTFGSAGFRIRNKNGEAVAAVLMINKGVVYLKKLPAQERFLLAAACAALLLEDQILAEKD